MLLTVAIPTTHDRQVLFDKLVDKISGLTEGMDDVQIIYAVDNYELSIGAKRNQLLNHAKGKYFVMVDSDDDIHDDYFSLVMPQLSKEPDCIGYYELIVGAQVRKVKHSITCKQWTDTPLQRTPFYKTPIRTDIAKAIGFEDKRYGEDHVFAKAIYPLLRKEIFIDEALYIYNQPKPMSEVEHKKRYGIR